MRVEPESGWLADRVNALFDAIRDPDSGEPYSNEDLARWCARYSGATMSRQFVWQLRRGDRDNPTLRHLRAIAAFFGVELSYFEPGERGERMAEQLRLARTIAATDGAERMVMRGLSLTPESRRAVARMIEELAREQDGDQDGASLGGEDDRP